MSEGTQVAVDVRSLLTSDSVNRSALCALRKQVCRDRELKRSVAELTAALGDEASEQSRSMSGSTLAATRAAGFVDITR